MQHQHQQGAPLPPAYGPGNPLSTGPFPPHHYPQGPMPPADDGWGKVGVLMVFLALAFAGGVAYFIATSESSEAATAAATEQASAEDGTDGESAAAEGSADDKTAGDKTAGDETAGDETAGDETAGDETTADGDSETDGEPAEAALPNIMSDGGVAADLIAEANPTDTGTGAEAIDMADAGADPLRANGEVDRPTGLVSMSIESEPPGAEVIRKSDGVRLGVTPYRYEVESASGNVVFILKLDGHRSMSLPMPADRNSERQVVLFEGSGGAPIPVAPEPTALVTSPAKAKADAPGKVDKPATAAKPAKPKKVEKSGSQKKPAKRPKKVVKPKKSRGTVDYNADAIPLD